MSELNEHGTNGTEGVNGANGESAPGLPAQAADTRPLRERLSREAKQVGRTATELEQAALFDEVAFEPAFFLSAPEVEKRYTAEAAKKIEMRRRTCLYLLSRNCPISDIMDLLEMNFRTVSAIAAQNGKELAAFSDQYSQELLALAGGAFALAETKKDEASYLQLVTGGGIMTDKAIALKLIGSGAAGMDENAIDVEEENPKLQAARKYLEERSNAPRTT